MTDPRINRAFVTKPIRRTPQADAARRKWLERERERDALEAMKSLQRAMRERCLEQDEWHLPEPKTGEAT